MDTLQPGHCWKTPFYREPGWAMPATSALTFEAAPGDWLLDAVAQVMADSLDESDRHAVARSGSVRAAGDLLALAPQHFETRSGWWRRGLDANGRPVGFVLPVLFRAEKNWKDGRPEGTIFYMGVLPPCRGHGHAFDLLVEATRIFDAAHCWRVFCDTGTDNVPMVHAFRRAGYQERAPWQRSLA